MRYGYKDFKEPKWYEINPDYRTIKYSVLLGCFKCVPTKDQYYINDCSDFEEIYLGIGQGRPATENDLNKDVELGKYYWTIDYFVFNYSHKSIFIENTKFISWRFNPTHWSPLPGFNFPAQREID